MVKEQVKAGGLVKAAEYARMRGVSEAAISKAISSGAITLFDGLIHPDLADAQWYRTSRAAKQQARAGALPEPAASAPAAGAGDGGQGASRQRVDDELWQQLKRDEARRARAEADKAEMQAAQLAGRLIEAGPFLQALTDMAATLGAAMDRVADKLAERLAAEADAGRCHDMITTEMTALRRDAADAVERMGQQVERLQLAGGAE